MVRYSSRAENCRKEPAFLVISKAGPGYCTERKRDAYHGDFFGERMIISWITVLREISSSVAQPQEIKKSWDENCFVFFVIECSYVMIRDGDYAGRCASAQKLPYDLGGWFLRQ